MMTLQEAIAKVKTAEPIDVDWQPNSLKSCVGDSMSEAIATILNAVVKGELKHE